MEFGHFVKDFLGLDDKSFEHLKDLQSSFKYVISSFTLIANEFNGFFDSTEDELLNLELEIDNQPKLSRLFTTEKSAQLSTMPEIKMERLFSS